MRKIILHLTHHRINFRQRSRSARVEGKKSFLVEPSRSIIVLRRESADVQKNSTVICWCRLGNSLVPRTVVTKRKVQIVAGRNLDPQSTGKLSNHSGRSAHQRHCGEGKFRPHQDRQLDSAEVIVQKARWVRKPNPNAEKTAGHKAHGESQSRAHIERTADQRNAKRLRPHRSEFGATVCKQGSRGTDDSPDKEAQTQFYEQSNKKGLP
ncbi:AAEL013657-PA [Aedes aegypti]|uniref:AAEL013657-PA n=1 Tax=Aedes aegypti TaxID=7159 RepID=Q16IH9_AEDAE|nr:AAEL013657-PA [Aedes aegypti]